MVVYGFMFLCACRSEKLEVDTSPSPDWWETEEDDSSSIPDDKDENDDKDTSFEGAEVEGCGAEFNPNSTCQGDWTTTLCLHDDILWWCDNGVWMSEEDK